jgi:hypothetical protein
MKTTLVLNDALAARLKREAQRQGRTMSEIVEEALHLLFNWNEKKPKRLPKLPRFDGGELLVDISDRDALYEAMEKED